MMLARRCSSAPMRRPNKQVRAGATQRVVARPALFGPSVLERKLNEVLANQHEMKKDIIQLRQDTATVKEDIIQLKEDIIQVKEDIIQLKQDTAINRALVGVNLTPAASLVLGVLYIVYNKF